MKLNDHNSLKNNIALFGPIPPPLGGVAFHVKELANLLSENDKNVCIYTQAENNCSQFIKTKLNCESYNFKLIIKLFFITKKKLNYIHCHEGSWHVRFLISLLTLRGYSTILTIHSLRESFNNFSFFKRVKIWVTLNLYSKIIVNNNDIVNKLSYFKINKNKIKILPPWVPIKYKKRYLTNKKAKTFIESKSPILLISATKLQKICEQDVYGIDTAIRLISELSIDKYENIGLIILIGQITDKNYYESLLQSINKLYIKNNIYIIHNEPLINYLPFANLFLRLNNFDSYGISIMEALTLGVPAVATDVCERPPYTTICKNDNVCDIKEKVIKILENNLPTYDIEDYNIQQIKKLIKIYS